ncbi:MAG: NAD(P)H-binding protein [Actinomycetales bacterium]
MDATRTALVTGATGYIGSRLVPHLLDRGWSVRVLTRSADRIAERSWRDRVEVVEGDATSSRARATACAEVDVLYYLLHSMDGGADFAARDRELASGLSASARRAGLTRIVYLSGLHPATDLPATELSAHLASRVEVGEILTASGVPTAVLQAAVIVGSGSASFEMLRHLTNRLPAMVAPAWLDNRIQPIAIADVLHYLAAAADLPPGLNRCFDIGGEEIITYREMISRYARIAGRRRPLVLTLPVLTPKLASHWVGLVTPVPTGIAKPLVGSLIHEVVCTEHDLVDLVGEPPDGITRYDDAVAAALQGGHEPLPEPGRAHPARLTAADPAWAGDRRRW